MSAMPNPFIVPVGLLIGILVAAPVGPVNILCIQRAIERGFWGGIAAGMGAVLGDGLVALLAALGVGAISGAVEYHRAAIQIAGALVLLAFGAKLFVTEPRIQTRASLDGHATLGEHIWDIPKTFFLTISNPGAVLGLFAIFGGISTFVEIETTVEALTMVAFIMAGSLAWWVGLSALIGQFRSRIEARRLALINRGAGLALVAFGLLLLGELAWNLGLARAA